MSDLVDRISEVLREVIRTELGLRSGEYFPSAAFDKAAERVAAELQLTVPDRQFVDEFGRRWEWCGGTPETWAWRVTGNQLRFTEDRYRSSFAPDDRDYDRVRWVSQWSEVQP